MNQFNRKTALITGATGFIGEALCAYLFENGFKIRALTRQLNSTSVIEKNNYEWVFGDITKRPSLTDVCDAVDVVFHLAGFAHAHEAGNPEFKDQHKQVNLDGTINILNESARAGVKRFIYFSSVKACAESDVCVDETWSEKPTDTYGIAKRAAEEAVLSYCGDNNIIPIILRPALVYGVGCKGNLREMIKAIAKGYFPTPPPIQNNKSMVSLHDLCRAALLSAYAAKSTNPIFIVTDNVSYSIFQITQMIRTTLGKKTTKYYLPFWAWIILAKIGDVAQQILRKRLPINTQAVKKLFSNAAYCSQSIKNELQFEPELTLQDVMPLMIKECLL